MATAEQQLLSSMSPQMARLLDEQLAGQQAAQTAPQGYGGIVSEATRGSAMLGNIGRDMFGLRPQPGMNEQQALKQQEQKAQVAGAMQGAEGANRMEKLRNVAERLRATGTYENLMLAEQFEDKADAMQLQEDQLNIERGKVSAKAAGGGSATDGHLMKDASGNFYQTFNYKDKIGQPSVKYVPIGGSPAYDGKTTLVPVSKSGETVGMTAQEIVEAEVRAKGEIKNKEEFFKWKQGVYEDYGTAVEQKDTLQTMLQLTEELAASGDLQGGIGARAQELIFALTGNRPKNLGELQMLYSMDTLKRLKPLFGGNISDSERQALDATFPNIMSGGKVNLEKLSVLKRMTDKAHASANKKLSMTYEEYVDMLSGGGKADEKAEPKKRLVWTPDGWVAQ